MTTYKSVSILKNGEFLTKDLNLNITNTPDDNLIIQNELTGFNDNSDGFNIGLNTGGNAVIEMKENKDIVISNNNQTTAKFLSDNTMLATELNLTSSKLKLNNSFGTANQVLKINNDATALEYGDIDSSPWSQSGSNIYFNSGKVGIGTNNPENKALRVQGNTQMIGTLQVNGNIQGNDFNTETSKIKLNGSFGAAGQVLKVKSDGLSLNYENTNWNRDNNINWYNGGVGINVISSSNVTRALECRGEILLRSYYVNNVAKASLFLNNATQSSEESFILYTNPNYTGSGGGWGKVIIVRNNRNVGIGALPGATDKLYVNGNIVASGSIQGNSDARIKKNIGTANYPDIYNKFKKLRLTEYGYIDEYCESVGIPNEKVVNGLIAQELKEVYPDLVTIIDTQDIVVDDEKILSFENFHRIDFTKLVMKLIGVIKILQNDNEDNKNEIDDLKNEIETLEADNVALNTRISTLETALDTLINKLYDENILTD